jgi:hypothetical protein
MPKRNSNSKTTTTGKETNTSNKTTVDEKSSTTNKKQGAVNVKVPTARERAKDSDLGRRSDANSNEL